MINLTSATFDAATATDAVVLWLAEWNAPSQALGRRLEGMNLPMALAAVDVEHSPELAARFGVQGIPTLMLFRGGRPVQRDSWLSPKLRHAVGID